MVILNNGTTRSSHARCVVTSPNQTWGQIHLYLKVFKYISMYLTPCLALMKRFCDFIILYLYCVWLMVVPYIVVASSTTTAEMFVDKSYHHAFMKHMHKLHQTNEYTEMTLPSSDIRIRCLRKVLATVSDYFNVVFRCGLEESQSATIRLTAQPRILTSIVDYIFTGETEVTVDNIESLVKACDILQLDTLKMVCENLMLKQVELANRFAILYNLVERQQTSRRLMSSEFNCRISRGSS